MLIDFPDWGKKYGRRWFGLGEEDSLLGRVGQAGAIKTDSLDGWYLGWLGRLAKLCQRLLPSLAIFRQASFERC